MSYIEYKNWVYPLSRDDAEEVAKLSKLRGKQIGLTVGTMDGGGVVTAYWHHEGILISLFLDEDKSEYPYLFKTLKGAKHRLLKLWDETEPPNGERRMTHPVMMLWRHPDIGVEGMDQYKLMTRKLWGGPRQ